MSREQNSAYIVPPYTVSHITDEQYKTEQLLEIFMVSNFQDKEWFAQYLAYMPPSHILAHVNRKYHSQHPTSHITSTNQSEVERTGKFLGLRLNLIKPEEGQVAVVRRPEHKRR